MKTSFVLSLPHQVSICIRVLKISRTFTILRSVNVTRIFRDLMSEMASGLQRKKAMVSEKQRLMKHSAVSMLKKTAAGIHKGSAPYYKAMYAEKCLISALDKYTLAGFEGATTWVHFMEQEANPAIRELYHDLFQLDRMWVIVQQRYRLQLSEKKRLFTQLNHGEKEISNIAKQAKTAKVKVDKLKKQLDEAKAKHLRGKRVTSENKLTALEYEVGKTVRDVKQAQKRYGMALENHAKFKHNEVRKMVRDLAEAEVQLYEDCRKISETKAEICNLYMKKPYREIDEDTIRQVTKESRAALKKLYKLICDETYDDKRQTKPGTSLEEDYDWYACYRPIPEEETQHYDTDYLFLHDDVDNDSDDDYYDYVLPFIYGDEESDKPQREQAYLALTDKGREEKYCDEDDIFGTISSLKLEQRSTTERTDDGATKRASRQNTIPEEYDKMWYFRTRNSSDRSSGGSSRSSATSGVFSLGEHVRGGSDFSSITRSEGSHSVSNPEKPPLPLPRKKKSDK